MSSLHRVAFAVFATTFAACRHEAPAQTPPAVESVTAGADGRVSIAVDDRGYHPSVVRAAPGRALTLVFRRADALNCGEKVRFPSLHIERDLPVGQSVEIAVTVPASGQIGFSCGMNMYRGSVVAN